MDDETVGIALVLTSAIGFGTLGIFGVIAAGEGLSIPTVLALRFAIAAVVGPSSGSVVGFGSPAGGYWR